jgi:hypothetical protein
MPPRGQLISRRERPGGSKREGERASIDPSFIPPGCRFCSSSLADVKNLEKGLSVSPVRPPSPLYSGRGVGREGFTPLHGSPLTPNHSPPSTGERGVREDSPLRKQRAAPSRVSRIRPRTTRTFAPVPDLRIGRAPVLGNGKPRTGNDPGNEVQIGPISATDRHADTAGRHCRSDDGTIGHQRRTYIARHRSGGILRRLALARGGEGVANVL